MVNLKIYQICHNLITYFVTLTSPDKSQLGLIFRTGGSIRFFYYINSNTPDLSIHIFITSICLYLYAFLANCICLLYTKLDAI